MTLLVRRIRKLKKAKMQHLRKWKGIKVCRCKNVKCVMQPSKTKENPSKTIFHEYSFRMREKQELAAQKKASGNDGNNNASGGGGGAAAASAR